MLTRAKSLNVSAKKLPADISIPGVFGPDIACKEGNHKVVEVLCSYDADKNAKDCWGQTPLQGRLYAYARAI